MSSRWRYAYICYLFYLEKSEALHWSGEQGEIEAGGWSSLLMEQKRVLGLCLTGIIKLEKCCMRVEFRASL